MNYANHIQGEIHADEVVLGQGVVVEPGVLITGKGGPCRKVVLGDFCYIGHNSRIFVPEFSLGDYSKLHQGAFAHGVEPMQIGRNCWIGGNVVLDSMGGLDIDDNVGIGAQSQIWTHAQFGDIVEGSRFFSKKYMHIGKDAWLVGHCIVSPVAIGERSMALVGSVVTRDMLPNHIYGGSPAKDLTDKLGTQFEDRTVAQKAAKLTEIFEEFFVSHPEHRGALGVAEGATDVRDDGRTWFNVADRTYTRTCSAAEVAFLKAWVPLVKFTPAGAAPFVVPRPI
jgi:acetyltransferase-like isoleucine patch superfamily enzyme